MIKLAKIFLINVFLENQNLSNSSKKNQNKQIYNWYKCITHVLKNVLSRFHNWKTINYIQESWTDRQINSLHILLLEILIHCIPCAKESLKQRLTGTQIDRLTSTEEEKADTGRLKQTDRWNNIFIRTIGQLLRNWVFKNWTTLRYSVKNLGYTTHWRLKLTFIIEQGCWAQHALPVCMGLHSFHFNNSNNLKEANSGHKLLDFWTYYC